MALPPLPPPPLDTPLSGAGLATQPWHRWLRQLWDVLRQALEDISAITATATWTAATYQNSWVSYSGQFNDAAYWKDPLGMVHVRGLVKNGTITLPVFTLPSGYRPARDHIFACLSNNGGGYVHADVRVATDGTVTPVSGNNTWVSLDGISFQASA